MLCAVICGPSFNEAKKQIEKACEHADLVEFCVHRFAFLNIQELMAISTLPVILTHREASAEELHKLAELDPDYLDVPFPLDVDFPRIIRSFHDWEKTPDHLHQLYQKMRRKPAAFYKIATMANSTLDAMRMLIFVKENGGDGQLIGLCMGDTGQATRILAPVVGSALSFAFLEGTPNSAPGQLSVETLKEMYHYHTLNKSTQVLGLIGDPVSKSVSNRTHNAVLRALNKDAVYCKFQVKPEELEDFFHLSRQLDFDRFSVTMPLKEHVATLLNAQEQAINTVKGNATWNTDGVAALDALEEKTGVYGKKIVILGAGGAARAIVQEAHKRGAELVVLNRTPEKARALATSWGGLDEVPEDYDILINCTSVGMLSADLPIPPEKILPTRVVMDIISTPKYTPLLQEAQKRECTLVFGMEMFTRQAAKQFAHWFDDVSEEQVRI